MQWTPKTELTLHIYGFVYAINGHRGKCGMPVRIWKAKCYLVQRVFVGNDGAMGKIGLHEVDAHGSPSRLKYVHFRTYSLLRVGRHSDLLQAGRSEDRIPVGARYSAPVQTGPGVRPVSFQCAPRLFPEGKPAGAWP